MVYLIDSYPISELYEHRSSETYLGNCSYIADEGQYSLMTPLLYTFNITLLLLKSLFFVAREACWVPLLCSVYK